MIKVIRMVKVVWVVKVVNVLILLSHSLCPNSKVEITDEDEGDQGYV